MDRKSENVRRFLGESSELRVAWTVRRRSPPDQLTCSKSGAAMSQPRKTCSSINNGGSVSACF